MVNTFLRDLRHAVRTLAARPGFTISAVACLAIGIGATTAIFSVVYGVLLRPLPYPGEERLVDVAELNGSGRATRVSDANFLDWRDRNRTLEAMAEYSGAAAGAVATPAEALRTQVSVVSARFFDVLGVRPSVGRGFGAAESAPGAAPVALVSADFWQSHMGGTDALASIPLRIDGVSHTVVGVMPGGFHFPAGAQIWTARERFPWLPSRTAHNNRVIGRVRAGTPLAAARADLSAIARSLAAENGKSTDMVDAAVTPLKETIVGKTRPALLLLLGAAAALFLVGCIDVVALLLARAASRRREIAVRRALGAGRLDLVRTFLAEALAICIPGGILGVAIASAVVRGIARLAPPGLPRVAEIAVDAPALSASVVLALLAAGALAVATAWAEYGSRLADVLRGHQVTGNVRARRAQRALSIGQLAVTAALLAGVSLLGRSLTKLLDVPLGFQPRGVLTMDLDFPDDRSDAGRARRRSDIAQALERVGRLPGVEKAGATDALPIGADAPDGTFLVMQPGQTLSDPSMFERLFKDPARTGSADFALATGGYFAAMGIPLLRGRTFEPRDTADAPHVAVVSETLARRRFADRDPLGQTIEFGNMDGDLRVFTIVGVVGDVHESRLENPPEPILYGNLFQRQKASTVTIALRAAGDPLALAESARRAVAEIDPRLPLTIRTMDEVIAESVASRRVGILLLSVFGLAALALACTGLAGITAYSIAQRQREMGIRAALGARPAGLLALLLSEQSRIVAAGVAAGTLLAIALGGVARVMLFGVAATDPLSLASAAAVLAASATIAILIPSLRLLRLPAAEALRTE
jgi:putative ABC transport system permease protein